MSLWTAATAAEATGGKATSDWQVNGVSIDTRSIQPGDLFVALKDIRDGHDFVAQALAKGAGAAMVSHIPDGVDPNAPLLIVDDVLPALERLGQAARARCKGRVVAVTGSVGKTSTKEMLRDVLSAQGPTHAAEASYNNHWGVPLTLARMPADTQYGVIEIGMNHPGEIGPLSRLARPNVAMITTVAAAHLEAFENIDGIAVEKAAIFDGLEPKGTAVINANLDTTPILLEAAQAAKAQITTFGESADYALTNVTLGDDTTLVQANLPIGPALFKIQSAGRHFAMNGLGALAVVDALGADVALAAIALGQWRPPAGRGMREVIVLDEAERNLSVDLIDDAYNANPTSLAAAIEVLAAATPRQDVGGNAKGRRVAILGDMLELGADELQIHADMAGLPGMDQLDLIHCIGPRMAHLWKALPEPQRGLRVDSAAELAEQAHQLIDAGDVVLVKGSNGSKVSTVVAAIRKAGCLSQ